ncbi:hypothetical protein K435DRAFT_675095 [Dendrothele bispora CBS 962.96]|uniref:DUF6533 domain-containing protein n=1 Tax=Dendrothele bispora (strain CBS 962.96) TaxID=1314807 RepID=A0A4S8LNK2_DENBC|nr:hypothetical protein K435DRAFT_675095 [Dendrothele bispora CBS 962.96]
MSDPTSISPLFIDELHQLQIATYITIATLGMYIWDICSNLTDEYKLLLKAMSRPLPTIVYFIARYLVLKFTVCNSFFTATQIQNCQTLVLTSLSFCAVALSSVTLLFFLRLRAIFEDNLPIVGIFFVLWLGNVACASMLPLVFTGVSLNFQGVTYCIGKDIRVRNASISAIGLLVHDTCVFIAISYRLLKNGMINDQKTSFRIVTKKFILGKNLPWCSKIFFQGSQLLYLITLVISASTVILLHIPSIPIIYRVVADIPQMALLTSLACKVFRDLRLGKVSDKPLSHKSHC